MSEPRLPTRAIPGSIILLQLGSVLMSKARVTTIVCDLGYHMKPCSYLRIVLPLRTMSIYVACTAL